LLEAGKLTIETALITIPTTHQIHIIILDYIFSKDTRDRPHGPIFDMPYEILLVIRSGNVKKKKKEGGRGQNSLSED
jgi:hypothetical protein